MAEKLLKPFSIRFRKALVEKTLKVSMSPRTRNRLWFVLDTYGCQTYYHPTPGDNWTETSTLIWDIFDELRKCHGWNSLEYRQKDGTTISTKVAREFFDGCYPSVVFDVIELMWTKLNETEHNFQTEVNDVLDSEDMPWRLLEGEMIQLDTRFLDLITDSIEQKMKVHGFQGALQEFKDARNDLIAGDSKGAIHNACKSMESILQTILKMPDANADRLLKALMDSGFLDDLPETRREGFRQQVLKTLPSMRNAYGGHGQGAVPVEIPRTYGDLAVNLAAAFNHFLITKHIASLPPPLTTVAPAKTDGEIEDDLPF